MATKIRLARGGSKKRPHYAIVASDSRMPRDGRFLEKLGTYNPLLAKDSEDRIKMDLTASSIGWTWAHNPLTGLHVFWKLRACVKKQPAPT